jgi:hypothetical protein
MKRKHSNTLSDHHILPKSRGGQKERNIKRVPSKQHQAYHTLLSNLTPDEVIQYLKEVWFTPKGSYVRADEWLANQ